MNDTERDALLRRLGDGADRFDRAATDMRLAAHEMRRVTPTIEDHEERITALEQEARGDARRPPSDSQIPVQPDGATSVSSLALVPPLGPHRPLARSVTTEVRESIRVQSERAQRIEVDTAKQTPMLETIVASATRTPMWTALASGAGIFLAYFLATLVQQCGPGATPFQRPRPLIGPTAAQAAPAPATSSPSTSPPTP